MARTRLSPSRQANIKNTNIGKIILFCEGETEKNYFEYFADILTKNKYNNIQVVVETASGNASRVLNAADEYLKNEVNLRKYANYKKYLVFDCDAPPNIQRVINKMLISMNNYELVVSNHIFEIWLLMYFEEVELKLSKKKIYEKLTLHLNTRYEKASAGIIRKIIKEGAIESALRNAEALEAKYMKSEMDITHSIGKMNPYTNVHILVEQLMSAISN